WSVPVVVAVVPMPAEPHLAIRLAEFAHIKVAAHGFAHRNHALPGEKKQELGPHRPAETVLEELSIGLDRLVGLFSGQAVPMLVPPWNRIAAELLPRLPQLGIRYLSAFDPSQLREPVPDLLQVDCQLDIIDWRARGAHPHEVLAGRLAGLVRDSAAAPAPIGILSHHLAHDEKAWQFLTHLFRLTARHEAVTWGWPVPDFYA
ncbi:MAG TPA: polysaccharide deacetylase, partial [Aestuariivirgaceae bacterium]|nr:polysaccharide deacetylase [Aestuariivirgaceae bacterium]